MSTSHQSDEGREPAESRRLGAAKVGSVLLIMPVLYIHVCDLLGVGGTHNADHMAINISTTELCDIGLVVRF